VVTKRDEKGKEGLSWIVLASKILCWVVRNVQTDENVRGREGGEMRQDVPKMLIALQT
jgi:hypothetical protein